jgi:lysophospholipase L1-like esterase
MEDDNKDKIIENNIINKNNEGNDIKEPENVKEIIQDNLNNNSQKESEKEISKELKENNQALNINLKDNIFDKEFKKKEKERKKLEKQERKNKLLAKKHKSPEEIENEKIFAENNKILINFLGDSITEGLKWQKKEIFCFYLSKWLNIRINNQGYHATRIARQDDDDKDFNFRLKDLDEKADFTFIFGGTNDYGMGESELGDINSDSYYTFYGALKNLVKDLLSKFNNDKICFILPLSRFEEDKIIKHGTLQKYRDIIKEICDLNKIDTLDLCKELPIPNTEGKSEFFKDGLHPNKQGHKLIARNIIKYLKSKGIINKNFQYQE